jgi:hypothetical protein
MKRVVILVLLPAILSGCGRAYYMAPSASSIVVDPSSIAQRHVDLTGSLFPSDQQVMSNEAIAQVLASRITLPAHARLALMAFEPRAGWYGWSEELNRLDQQAVDTAIAKLKSSNRIAAASPLPSLLVPEKRSVPHLREAAARYQADLLLVYRTNTFSYEKQKLVGRDETRAYCLVEAVLIDVRTGIVPFSASVTREYTARKSAEDLNFSESIQKARLRAFGDALEAVAADLVRFLSEVPEKQE